jgi:dihydroorotate dehydrogenase electron transfer subunit
MTQEHCRVLGCRAVGQNIYVLAFISDLIGTTVRPGQFLNIRVEEASDPLLRRPFSVYAAEGGRVEIVFNVIGRGTAALCRKRQGETLDVLGPLGRPFAIDGDEYRTGVLIAGGLGVAPMPLTTRALRRAGKGVLTCLGARTAAALVEDRLEQVEVATDDGSRGFKGTAVDLARRLLAEGRADCPKIFACGPTAMLRAVGQLARELDIPCEVSLEGPMACGFGICQGCPVELADTPGRYVLMCKDGPTFDVRRIKV